MNTGNPIAIAIAATALAGTTVALVFPGKAVLEAQEAYKEGLEENANANSGSCSG